MSLLTVHNLQASVEDKHVLRGATLDIQIGEVHALMGANGSGKTTLSQVLMGNATYRIHDQTDKTILFDGHDLLAMTPDERARAGLYLAWQAPITIPGVTVFSLCRVSYSAMGHSISKLTEFKKQLELLAERVGLTKEHIGRNVNEGFSGGERKRLELLQLLLLKPKLAVLDEIDSGLDVDALRMVGEVVNEMKQAGTAFLLITHYKRLLEYVSPDYVHVMKQGKIAMSGGTELVTMIEKDGYEKIV